MGTGIVTAFLQSGLKVTLVEPEERELEKAPARIRDNWSRVVKRGQLTSADVEERMERFVGVADLSAVDPVPLYVEAAWESMAVKKAIFEELSERAPAGAVLATNTSTLNIDEIAASTDRPEDVLGLHFFNPAFIMKLLEVVRGEETSTRCLAIAMEIARKLRKTPVVVGVCKGFVGNRMFSARDSQAKQMLMEGAKPQQIDSALTNFGFPMGTFTLYDMVGGIELAWRVRQETGDVDEIGDALYEAGRLGMRVGMGYYQYEPGSRRPLPDPEVDLIISQVLNSHGVAPREISEQEIVDRMILPMINEAAKILEEGIAERASDIDVVWTTGYGWPVEKGGPAYFADQLGLDTVVRRLRELQAVYGDNFAPSRLLVSLAKEGKRLRDE